MTNKEVLDNVDRGYRMPCPPGCPPELYEIMLEGWKSKPMERPTFETLQWKLEEFFVMEGEQYREASTIRWEATLGIIREITLGFVWEFELQFL